MKKRFLGIICLLYSSIILYVWMSDRLKNFLAPQMQVYIKLSLIPITIIGLVVIFNNHSHYKFKLSDLILILPIVILILSGDGRLTSSIASNRNINTNRYYNTKSNILSNTNIDKEEVDKEYDFSNPYFNIIDNNYNELSNYITFEPKAEKFQGKTIKAKGFAISNASYLPDGYTAIGKYAITCCAADAEFMGFIIKTDKINIKTGKWYQFEGVLEKGKDNDGYDIMYVKVINIKEINSKKETQYVYPCYTYGEDVCFKLSEKYDLEY